VLLHVYAAQVGVSETHDEILRNKVCGDAIRKALNLSHFSEVRDPSCDVSAMLPNCLKKIGEVSHAGCSHAKLLPKSRWRDYIYRLFWS